MINTLIAFLMCIMSTSLLSLVFKDTPVNGSYDFYLSTIIHFIFFRLLLLNGND